MSETRSQVYHIQTKISGRYLVQAPPGKGPFPLIVGFHGYGEDAETQLSMLKNISATTGWVYCAIQALHPFYLRSKTLGACWMTSQDQELRIQENIDYVDAVLARLTQDFPLSATLVFHGFSQGTAMACRAAVLGHYQPSSVLLLGSGIPSELHELTRMTRILLARGTQDRLYPFEQWTDDRARLEQSNIEFRLCVFDGGHSGTPEYYEAASTFLMDGMNAHRR
ncbi:phospholipase [candidate division KSB3 bacterium]|uniref:Phospholipase n=1 Tax=candidate division KSB3 bacterium TaxID=2044937 RepID=A0A2G6E5J1_9BACT|nr:MAG: phospholipase [candidate division KSB3 bacterium]PIE29875.1 MAG: phospholipase [candidate division KSB3 bacterium]